MNDHPSINDQIEAARQELAELDTRRIVLVEKIRKLEQSHRVAAPQSPVTFPFKVTMNSSKEDKIALFRSLFKGREDVFPRRFESKSSEKSGYQPECRKQWIRGVCGKPRVKCGVCEVRDLVPVSDDVIASHLTGKDLLKRDGNPFTMGVYPLLSNDTCWFLVVDFDKALWQENSRAFMDICQSFDIPASLERSRSGNGAHIWIFFTGPLPAKLARQMGTFLLTQTLNQRPEMGFDSYDRLFPSQDTLTKGGFGNLIALPLQKEPRNKGNSVFVDERFVPYPDQWEFLSSIRRMPFKDVERVVMQAVDFGGVLDVRYAETEEDETAPWKISPSGRKPTLAIKAPLPDAMDIVLGNQIFIPKDKLPPPLRNRLIRLAAFQNPEFHKAQAMRFSTFGKPRIVHCGEDFPNHIGLPRGCMEDVIELFDSLNIGTRITDERFQGTPIQCRFTGILRPDQNIAADAMLAHDTGVLSASTAFGKTVIAAYLIAERAVNTLVLVHRKQLLDQWIARLQAFLDIAPEGIGQIGSGKRQLTAQIDVGIIQSLNREGIVDDIVADYGHIVVDECHHISARSFEIVAKWAHARYVTGLTATTVRKDGLHPIIFMNCGPVRHKVDDKKEAAKRPFSHHVVVRKTPFQLPISPQPQANATINEIYSGLIADEERNRMIVEDIVKAVSNGRFPLILTERKEHITRLGTLLTEKIQHVIVMTGGMKKKDRTAAFESLANLPLGSEQVILATGSYIGEGFDEKRLDTLFLTLPISWKGTIAQYAGRLHRIHEMKQDVLIYDYVDMNIPMLSKMFERRIQGYRSIGYDICYKL